MNELLTFGILSFTSFFTLINPLGTMPIFMTMTKDLDQQHRTRIAKKASIAAFLTIIIFAFAGQLLFNFFGISANSFRIVGGVIIFLMGMDMLQVRLGKVKVKESEIKISMDGKGRWIDNVFIERLWRSLKYEEVYLKAYDRVADARQSLGKYFTLYYQKRRHQSLDRQTPGSVYYQQAAREAA